MVDFYAGRPLRPILGLQEGETRKKCPPGTVLSNLPSFPWSECIPESQAMGPSAPVPHAPPPVAPRAPAAPTAPKKARFLTVDEQSGDLLDPDTGAIIETQNIYALDTTETVAVGAGLGIIAILLAAAGVFK